MCASLLRLRAAASSGKDTSTPTTRPADPTASASCKVVCPLPQPTSRTCSPRRGASARRAARPSGSSWRSSRSCWATHVSAAPPFQYSICAVFTIVDAATFMATRPPRPGRVGTMSCVWCLWCPAISECGQINCPSTQLSRPRLELRRKREVELGEVLLREVQIESPAVFPDVIERRRSRYDGYSRPADQPRERDLCRRRAMALGHAP